MRDGFAAKLAKLYNKNSKLMLIPGDFGVMILGKEDGHDRGNQAASEAIR